MAHFITAGETFYGKGALSEAASCLKKAGMHPLIVTGPHIGKSPMMDNLLSVLSDISETGVVYSGITGEPTDTMIEEGVRLFKKNNCDYLIGIGGGSPLDSAKAIAAMSVFSGEMKDYSEIGLEDRIPPVIAVPTTAGTGSETTRFFVVTDTKRDVKMLLGGYSSIPSVAVLDPAYTVDMPRSVTASTGLDALTHAVEAYTSKKASHLTDMYAVSAVEAILKYLPTVYKDGRDEEARGKIMLAAYEAGVCINNSSVTIVHGMSRPIGALFHVPHGLSNAMLLPDALLAVADGAYDRFASLSRAVHISDSSDDKIASEELIAKLKELTLICEVPTPREYGISYDEFHAAIPKMSEDAMASGSPSNCRKAVDKDLIASVYRKVFP